MLKKKFRALASLLLALMLVSLAIIPAFAAEKSVNGCSHSDFYYVYECQVSWYQYYNQTQHKHYYGDRYVCTKCGAHKVVIIPSLTETAQHSYGALQYIRSDHSSSNPANHYYIRQRICPVCNGAYETHTYSTGCTSSGCVDPQGFGPTPVTE